MDRVIGGIGAFDGQDGGDAGLDEGDMIAGKGVERGLDHQRGMILRRLRQGSDHSLAQRRAFQHHGRRWTVDAADHVHVQHRPDAPALGLRERRDILRRSQKPLFFAPEQKKDQIMGKVPRGHGGGQRQHPGRAAGIVVGAGGGGRRAGTVIDGIKMRAHKHHPAPRFGSLSRLGDDQVQAGGAADGDAGGGAVQAKRLELALRPCDGVAEIGAGRMPGPI